MTCNSDWDSLVPNSLSPVVIIKRTMSVFGHFGYIKFPNVRTLNLTPNDIPNGN